MATRSFDDLAQSARAGWTDDARAFSVKADAYFEAQLAAHRSLGAAFLEARQKANFTQAELSARSSVRQPEISRIEKGLGNPTSETLFKMAAALGVSIDLRPIKSPLGAG